MAPVWEELKRRNVVRVAIAYAVVSWLLLQIADVILNNIETPDWIFQVILLLLAIGFPIALILAWAFELTPAGIRKETDVDRSESITHLTGRKFDFVIIGVLAVAVSFLLVDKLLLEKTLIAPGEIIVTERKSIAVLPFVNRSDDPVNEYFSDGIAEEILNLLAKLPELRVSSRSSAFSFKGQNLDVPTMAARLGVGHVLEGSVRKAGDQVRITAQLVDVNSDTNIWSETYDRQLDSIFAIQDEIAAAVVDALHITLLGNNLRSSETDLETYGLYLQARHFGTLDNATPESIRQAENLLKQALESDPEFVSAWIELANVYLLQAMVFGIRSTDESTVLAHEAVRRALALDPQNGHAYATLARVEMNLDWEFETAYQTLKRALSLDPGNADILQIAARLEYVLGRPDRSIELYRQSIGLDPLSGNLGLAVVLHSVNRLQEAEETLRKGLLIGPAAAVTRYRLGLVLTAQGDAAAGLAVLEKEPDDGWRLAGLTIIQYVMGNREASDAALEELIEKFASDAAFQIAEAYAFRNENDRAFEWLERAYENRDSGMTNLLLAPLIANLRGDPRWEPLLDKMKLPH